MGSTDSQSPHGERQQEGIYNMGDWNCDGNNIGEVITEEATDSAAQRVNSTSSWKRYN